MKNSKVIAIRLFSTLWRDEILFSDICIHKKDQCATRISLQSNCLRRGLHFWHSCGRFISRLQTHVAILESGALNPVAKLSLSGFLPHEAENYRKCQTRLYWVPHASLLTTVTLCSDMPDFADLTDACRHLDTLAAICRSVKESY